jgi:hypothetical protein
VLTPETMKDLSELYKVAEANYLNEPVPFHLFVKLIQHVKQLQIEVASWQQTSSST